MNVISKASDRLQINLSCVRRFSRCYSDMGVGANVSSCFRFLTLTCYSIMSLLSFFRWSMENTANGKEACQDDWVQVCLLSYLLKKLLIFSLLVDFRLRNRALR